MFVGLRNGGPHFVGVHSGTTGCIAEGAELALADKLKAGFVVPVQADTFDLVLELDAKRLVHLAQDAVELGKREIERMIGDGSRGGVRWDRGGEGSEEVRGLA